MNPTLTHESQQVQQQIQRGIDWLNQYAEPEKRIGTLNELGKLRRRAKRLEQAAGLRPALAVFGQSQVGKSFLVSNLARTPGQDLLQIESAGHSDAEVRAVLGEAGPISFIDHINPRSETNEATGVITRFTTASPVGERGYKIRLFSQTDLVKVLTKSYQENVQDSEYVLGDETIRQAIDRVQQAATAPVAQAGMSADDVLDIRDFLRDNLNDRGLIQSLQRHEYWESIADYLPRLEAMQRHIAFEFLWNQNAFMTSLFSQLSNELARLQFSGEVWCGLDAIAPTTDTIVDVNRLGELNHPTLQKPEVSVRTGNGQSILLNRSILTALATELVLPLPKSIEQHPERKFLQHADVLDFPGARSNEQKTRDVFDQSDMSEKMTAFRRGKVAYLFDRYNDTFEISSLLFCHDNTQGEVNSLPGLLYKWIGVNVGKSAQEREQRELDLLGLIPVDVRGDLNRVNPFFFILTKINENLNKSDVSKAGRPQEHDQKWNSRLVKNYSDFMKKASVDNWTEKWNLAEKPALKNTFIVRDPAPKFSRPCYTSDTGVETVDAGFQAVFSDLRQSFVNSPDVQRHFYDPARMWQEAIEPEQNGLAYLIKYLTPACHPAIKSEQVRVALDGVRQDVGRQLCGHYEGGSVEEKLKRARERRERVVRPVGRLVMEKQLGQFLASMTIAEQYMGGHDGGMWDRELCRQVLKDPSAFMKKLEADDPVATEITEPNDLGVFLGEMLGDFDAQPASLPSQTSRQAPGLADRYAENLLGRWVVQLKDNADNGPFLRRFGLAKEEADIVVEEMIRSMERDGLKDQLAGQVTAYMQQISNLEIVLSIGRATVNEFVQTLGWSRVGAGDKLRNKAVYQAGPDQVVPIFDETARSVPDKAGLKMDHSDPARSFYSQWFRGFYQGFEYNVLREANFSDPERAHVNGLLEVIIRDLNYQC